VIPGGISSEPGTVAVRGNSPAGARNLELSRTGILVSHLSVRGHSGYGLGDGTCQRSTVCIMGGMIGGTVIVLISDGDVCSGV
jgi:hypothetical protein